MIFSLILRGYKKVLSRVHEYAWVTLFVSIALLYVLGYFVMLYAGEDQILENYTWWFSVTITTVGYGDYSPLTTYGRICAGFIMFIGIGTVGLVIGKVAESVIDFANKNRKGLRKMKHEKHTIIMGYRQGRTEKVIAELLSNNPAEKLVLCSFDQKENPIRFRGVDFVMGELASEDVLQRSSAVAARNIIIWGASDNETFITAYAFRSVNTSAQMVCYLNNADHAEKIARLPALHTALNNVILPTSDYLLAQELQDRESSSVVQQLIRNLDGENLYRFDIPPGNVAVDYLTVFIGVKKKYGATVLAVKDSHLTLNPDLVFIVKSGMALFYTAPTRLADIDLAGLEVQP